MVFAEAMNPRGGKADKKAAYSGGLLSCGLGFPGRWVCWLIVWVLLLDSGCGTSRWTDTSRTATEQLLISDAIDRAVSRLDFRALAGKSVYLDDTPIRGLTDANYLTSTLRQHLLASGAILKENKNDADYVVEVRAGAIGTDRHDVVYGLPAVNLPTVLPSGPSTVPTQLPEIPLVKKTQQRAVAKIAVFAYNRQTGRPIWQSGAIPIESNVRAVWVFGAGPFMRSPSGKRVTLAGDPVPLPPVHLPLDPLLPGAPEDRPRPSVTDEAFFVDRSEEQVRSEEKVSPATPEAPGASGDLPAGVSQAEPAATSAATPEAQASTGPADGKEERQLAQGAQAAPGDASAAEPAVTNSSSKDPPPPTRLAEGNPSAVGGEAATGAPHPVKQNGKLAGEDVEPTPAADRIDPQVTAPEQPPAPLGTIDVGELLPPLLLLDSSGEAFGTFQAGGTAAPLPPRPNGSARIPASSRDIWLMPATAVGFDPIPQRQGISQSPNFAGRTPGLVQQLLTTYGNLWDSAPPAGQIPPSLPETAVRPAVFEDRHVRGIPAPAPLP
jgi:hypothetical protein